MTSMPAWQGSLGACLAFAVLCSIALPAEAHDGRRDRHARAGTMPRATPAPRLLGTRPETRRHDSHRHHYHGPRAYSVPRVVVVPPMPRYAPPPVVYVEPPLIVEPPAFVSPPASLPPPPVSVPAPPAAWRPVTGPFLALDGASFVAGGVTYALTGLRAPDVATPRGAAGRARLQQLLDGGGVSVWRIAIDGYGRAMVRAIANGVELANQLRAEGFAAG